MPKVLDINGYKFSFYSNENNELPHVHISKGGGNAKIWLEPEVEEEYFYGFTIKEKRDIRKLIKNNEEYLINEWHEKFG